MHNLALAHLIFLMLYAVGLVAISYSNQNNKKKLFNYYNFVTLFVYVTYTCIYYVLNVLL